jgi:hypothetical protein
MAFTMKQTVAAVIAAAFTVSGAFAQQYVYPAKGQSADRQKKDEYECHQWAVKQTGVDPTKPPQQTAAAPTSPTTATGTTPGAGLRGAAGGAVVGAIVGDAGAGAAAGAVAARSQSRRQNAATQQQATQQQQQAQGAQQASYAKARGACLEGRGYSVK